MGHCTAGNVHFFEKLKVGLYVELVPFALIFINIIYKYENEEN